MRNTLVFSGTSCPALSGKICENLGLTPASADLSQFSNGETSVRILTSVREKDVFVVQSGSPKINDTIMELLIMISACKGGSANKVTAVLPYFPYSRQSKKKSHRGAITARMLANLMHVAGVKHVITIDLHASQMQGFFKCPVDNLHAEPLIARWIRMNVSNWKEAVVVSKNAGGTKRVTSLADALKLNFGIVTTDRKRAGANMTVSMIMNHLDGFDRPAPLTNGTNRLSRAMSSDEAETSQSNDADSTPPRSSRVIADAQNGQAPTPASPIDELNEEESQNFNDVRAQSDAGGEGSQHSEKTEADDPMAMSHASSYFAPEPHALGGSGDADVSSDEEDEKLKDPSMEHMITLVGDVKDRPVFIVDDMIDKPGSWIAAAETVVKRGHANKVYCMATHGVFGGDCLEQLQACECIDQIIVTNSFPISEDKAKNTSKLVILDLSFLLSEAIRRNHYGESISPLFQHIAD
ncbi:hypothetical protein PG994_013038 [Apiospora phragmitis]|uniref:ribose-phosphate diphosphokinase n=1 Tax=Apiospora phragmitis TaxID=2905665 RepID=A0ABR1T7H9_9PEZI